MQPYGYADYVNEVLMGQPPQMDQMDGLFDFIDDAAKSVSRAVQDVARTAGRAAEGAGKFALAVAPLVAPIVGGAVGGPMGAQIGGQIGGVLSKLSGGGGGGGGAPPEQYAQPQQAYAPPAYAQPQQQAYVQPQPAYSPPPAAAPVKAFAQIQARKSPIAFSSFKSTASLPSVRSGSLPASAPATGKKIPTWAYAAGAAGVLVVGAGIYFMHAKGSRRGRR